MHAIQMRSVSNEVYQRLKERARRNHRSIAGEALSILEKNLLAAEYGQEDIYERIGMVREQIALRYGTGRSSVEDIREDRRR